MLALASGCFGNCLRRVIRLGAVLLANRRNDADYVTVNGLPWTRYHEDSIRSGETGTKKGASEGYLCWVQADMRLQVAAKVVGRLRGEEFPHFEAACSARSAWVRRHYMPAAVVLAGTMLHETNRNLFCHRSILDLAIRPRQNNEFKNHPMFKFDAIILLSRR